MNKPANSTKNTASSRTANKANTNKKEKDMEFDAEMIIKHTSSFHPPFHDPEDTTYVHLNNQTFRINSDRFKDTMRAYCWDSFHKIINEGELARAITTLQAVGRINGEERKVCTRVAQKDQCIEYDLCQSEKTYIRVSPGKHIQGSRCTNTFYRPHGMLPQVIPDLTAKAAELLDLIKKYFRLRDEQEYLLLTCYLLSCFIPDIQHPLMMFHGNKGAAKTTALKLITRIVDPRKSSISTVPKSRDELALILGQNYLSAFDNLRYLSKDNSDLLCINCTGGSNTRRKLYSDSDLVSTDLSSIVVLNGIAIVGTQPDLLDRSIVFQLERVPDTERKPDKEFMAEFEQDLPKILGAIFKALSLAIGKVDSVQLNNLPRMADFARYGYVFARALGKKGKDFLKAYRRNLRYVQGLIMETEPTVAAVLAFMEDRTSYKSTPTELLQELEKTAKSRRIDVSQNFPKSASALSRRLGEIKDDLYNAGVIFQKGHLGSEKGIYLKNMDLAEMPTKPSVPTAKPNKKMQHPENAEPSEMPTKPSVPTAKRNKKIHQGE